MKRTLSILLALLLVLSIAPVGMAYTSEQMAAANALNKLGLFAGVGTNPDGTPQYDLDAFPNRDQGITMLVRLLGKEKAAREGTWVNSFTDVEKWAKPYVGYAYKNGLTSGNSATKFGGLDRLTPSHYTTFILRALGYKDNVDFIWSNPFALADSLGITKGKYNKNSRFTRGDVAFISNNALNVKMKGSNKTLLDTLIEAGAVIPEEKPETVERQVIYNKNGYKATVTGIEKDEDSEVRLNLLLENNTGSDITFQVRNVSVNGYMIDPTFSSDVAAGKKANDNLTFHSWQMKDYNFSHIADFEFSLTIFSFDDNSIRFNSDLIQVKTSAFDTYKYTFDDKGKVVYNDNGIRVVYKKIDTSETYQTSAVLFIENNTDDYLLLQVRDVSVNGFMIDPTFSADVSPHKRIIDEMIFWQSDLSENGIKTIDELEVKFFIVFNDSIKDHVMTDVIKIPV